MDTTREVLQSQDSSQQIDLWLAFELANAKWKLAFGDRQGRVHWCQIEAGEVGQLHTKLWEMRTKLGVGPKARIVSCYEAGRDGFWLHRWLIEQGIENIVVESASIEVNRRARRAKSDRLDGAKLLSMLRRYFGGERGLWQVLHIPSPEAEDARRPARERERLTREATAQRNRIRALLVLHNLRPAQIGGHGWANTLKRLAGAVPAHLLREIERESARLELVTAQLRELEAERRAEQPPQVRQLTQLKGIGPTGAAVLVGELFAWRRFTNPRQVGAAAGLTPTPYASGESAREQGISKAGNKRVRWMAVELGWSWLRYQPESQLSQWFEARFGSGGKRMRRIGIVALARRLLIELWHYLEDGTLPKGAQLKATVA